VYNRKLWTLNRKLENEIDIFQRGLLRKILTIKYPRIISNEKLHKITKEMNWSHKIKIRLTFLGHILRLPDNAPARIGKL